MVAVEPIPDEAAATIDIPGERLLVIADYHAGLEAALRYEHGVELRSAAGERKRRLLRLIDEVRADRLVILGDFLHTIGEPIGAERGEVEVLLETLELPVTIAKGNHDGILEEVLATDPARFGRVDVTPTTGSCIDSVGLHHGHTWPTRDVLEATILCIGHEHPCVRLTDEVGGRRIERVWLRGPLSRAVLTERYGDDVSAPELIVFPAFNTLCGGTWINVPEQEFLAPFLSEALPRGDVYLLDGTSLGDYRQIGV